MSDQTSISIYELLALNLFSFFILFTIRKLITRKIFISFYHIFFCFCLIVSIIGSGGLLNEDYARLEKFKLLEQNHELEKAKLTPENYDQDLGWELLNFKNSDEYMDYIKSYEIVSYKFMIVWAGWILVFLIDILTSLRQFLFHIIKAIKRKNKKPNA